VTTQQLKAPATHRAQLLESIRENLASFSAVELRIARSILGNPQSIINSSIGQFAAKAEVSSASAVRFCQGMGLAGFQALKLVLTRESPSATVQLADINPHDNTAAVSRKVVLGSAQALQSAAENIDHESVAEAASRIGAARRTLVLGVGTSAPLAADVAYRLALVGVDAVFAGDAHVQNIMASHLTSQDACLIISHTGSTIETLAAARAAKAAGAATLAVTSFTGTPLTDLADLSVVAGSQETAYRVDAMISRVVHLAVLDAIVVLLTHASPKRLAALSDSNELLTQLHRS
jgi:DNA-binding MurR/RpiR family transcriptional regulator